MNFKYHYVAILTIALFCQCNKSHQHISNVLIYNQPNPITSFDPAYSKTQNHIWVNHHIYSTLFQLDDNLNIIPHLIDNFNISSDGKIYYFKLKKNILFHKNPCFKSDNQRLLDAHDVKYSWDRLLNHNLALPGSWIFDGKVDPNKGIKVLSDLELEVHLTKAFKPFISLLTMQYTSIVPKEAIDYYKENFAYNPVGSGPFQFKKYIPNQSLYLIKYDQYFDTTYTTNLVGIKTTFIKDRKIAFLELAQGNIDFMTGIESSFIHNILNHNGTLKKEYTNIEFHQAPYLNFEYIGINFLRQDLNSPLRHKAFRQALNYAINRHEMLSNLRFNLGTPANSGVIPKGLPSYRPTQAKGYDYNPQKAKTLLKSIDFEKKYKNFTLEIGANSEYVDILNYVVKQWENIGIKAKMKIMETSVLREAYRNGDLMMYRASWIGDYPDGENFLSLFYSPNPSPPNYTRFANTQFDKLYRDINSQTDESIRLKSFDKANQLLIDEAPVIFLYYDQASIFASKKLKNVSKNALSLLMIKDLKKE